LSEFFALTVYFFTITRSCLKESQFLIDIFSGVKLIFGYSVRHHFADRPGPPR